MYRPLSAALLASALLTGLTACRDQEIVHYRIDKEVPPPAGGGAAAPAMTASAPMPPAAMPAAAVPTASAPAAALAWQASPEWTSQPAASPRRGWYVVSGDNGARAELVVTEFPGDVGGEAANLNRWRSQLQLATVADPAAEVQRMRVGPLDIAIVDLTGGSAEAPVRLLGAIVPAKENTWFFKFTGDPQLIEREQGAFRALLQTLHLSNDDHACCDS